MDKLKLKIYELIHKGEFTKAEAKLSNFIDYLNKIDGSEIIADYHIDAFNLISDLYIFLGKFEELYSCFYKIIYNNPNIHDVTKTDFFIKIGILLYIQEKYSDSEIIFFKTLEIMEAWNDYFKEEEKLIIYRFIAEIYKKTSKFEDSERFYNKANPKPIVIKNINYSKSEYIDSLIKYEIGMSDLYILQNNLSGAENILKESKYIESDICITFFLSDLYLKQGDIKKSEQLLEHIINTNPDLSLLLIAAADCLTIRGLYNEAIYFLKRALEINQKIGNKFFFLKRYLSLYRRQKSNFKIHKYEKRILKIAPKTYDSESLDHIGVNELWDYIISRYELVLILSGFCTYNSLYSGLNKCADLIMSGKNHTKDYFYSMDFYYSIPPEDIIIMPFFTRPTICLTNDYNSMLPYEVCRNSLSQAPNIDQNILNFYSDDHEEIRKVLGPPDDPDRLGFYLLTVGMILSDDPVERHIADLKSQHNSSLHSYYARKELMEKGIIDESGLIIDSAWISKE